MLTNPFAAGYFENLGKWGKDLDSNPFGIRYPLTVCCPTHAIIWHKLILEPFDPHTAIIRAWLSFGNLLLSKSPALSLILLSSELRWLYSVCSALQPGFRGKVWELNWLIN